MSGFSIGPFMVGGDRLAVMAGIVVFTIVSVVLSLKVNGRFDAWSTWMLLVGFFFARMGYVIEHLDTFAREPRRVFAVSAGGFDWRWTLIPLLVISLWNLHDNRSRLWACLPIFFGLASWATVIQFVNVNQGKELPSFTLARLDGGTATLGALGHPVVINLWASWCPPCRRELPTLMNAADSARDVRFNFVNEGESRDAVRAFLSRSRLGAKNVLLDANQAVSHSLRMPGYPVTLFIGADGRLRYTQFGEISAERLEDELKALRRID